MTILDLGMRDYKEIWRLQKEFVARRQAGEISDTLLIVEHPPVFTVGRAWRGVHPQEIGSIPCIAIERGGDITFHGPGQLVGYPIIDLRRHGRDVHRFLRDLEEVLMRTLQDFSLDAQRRPGLTGVWVGSKKIASIGIALSHWVSYHGFALNVSVDLRYFRMIRPCGLDGTVMTSMSELLGREIALAAVKPALCAHWAGLFPGEDHVLNVASVTLQY